MTRWRGTNNASLLDPVLTNEEGMVSDINIEAPLGKSDHSVILFRVNAHITSEYENTIYNLNTSDSGLHHTARSPIRRNWPSSSDCTR